MLSTSEGTTVKSRIERLVCVASGGSVTATALRDAGGVLKDVGLGSIGYMNLLESLERSFGIVIDPEEDPKYLVCVDSIVSFVTEQLGPAD